MSPRSPDLQLQNEYIGKLATEIGTDPKYKHRWYMPAVVFFAIFHVIGIYGAYLTLTKMRLITFAYGYTLGVLSGLSVTLGAHRLYAHKSYKASKAVQIVVNTLHVVAGQNSMLTWVRDHRLHHKYSDTDADPHNSNRGFFFCHMGWLMMRKHPAVKAKLKTIDLSDLKENNIVMFYYKYFIPLYILLVFATSSIPVIYFGESWMDTLITVYVFRYLLTLHFAWTVNSFAHLNGNRPYDKYLQPVENWWVSFLVMGEGWHNYHHAFPYDYKTGEYGVGPNVTAKVIDALAYVGHAWDLRTAPEESVLNRIQKRGDGTHKLSLSKFTQN